MTDKKFPPKVTPLRPGLPGPLAPGQQINVDLTNAKQRLCPECECEFFQPVIEVFILSGLANPTGQDLTIQKPVLICLECRAVLEIGKETR
jgi:hypothetical protein